MQRKSIGVVVVVFLSVLVAVAMAAQDKYTVKVPNGLAFSEFRGLSAILSDRSKPIAFRANS